MVEKRYMCRTTKGGCVYEEIKSFVIALLICGMVLGSLPSRADRATFSPSLSFSETTATCYVRIQNPGKTISATMELWHGTNKVDSWSGSGTSVLTLNETHSGCVSGWTYTLKINGTIGGVAFSEVIVSATC